VRLGDVGADRDAARVGVLDDRDRGLVEVEGGAQGRVGVDVVVVRHRLAVQDRALCDARRRLEVDVERALLVRVLAVAQHVGALQGEPRVRRPPRVVRGELTRAPLRHRGVVRRRVRERPRREASPRLEVEPACPDGVQDGAVRRGVDDDGDARVVLGGCADHRRATDVDLLDDLVAAGAGRDGLAERVEVAHDEVEGLDAELVELAHVVGQAAVGEDAGVHLRVQRLDPAVEALGEAGDVLDGGDRDAGSRDPRRGRAGRDQGHPGLVQPTGQLFEAALVVDAEQRPSHRDLVTDGRTHSGPPRDREPLCTRERHARLRRAISWGNFTAR
jgi:hypothetical protein